MNTCMTITCSTCEQDTDCRIGYSNRLIQPIQFACPHCHSALQITLDISDAPRSSFAFEGCGPSRIQPGRPFDGTNPFVDIHLDFPVKFGGYTPGLTPWFAALNQLQDANEGDNGRAIQLSMFHSMRLNILNQLYPRAEELKRVINLYFGANKQLFQKRAAEFLGVDQEQSLLQQDLNATLYLVIAKAFFPFVIHGHGKEISEELPNLLYGIDQEQLELFVAHLFDTGFLKDVQRDCLRIYPRVFDAEIPFRPALFLDFIEPQEPGMMAGRVSSQDFFVLKDLYKDILEIISRQIVIVAGINNLYHRGDFNSFKAIGGAALSSLQKMSEKILSDKFKYLDECWYNLSISDLNLGLRNAIAHNNIDYDANAQVVTYFPEGGRLNPAEGRRISFLEFMRSLLLAFREMHNLHHVIKTLYYFKLIVYDRRGA
ncbi:hypothetical protein I5T82_17205 [Stenotrophomonas maltophilia]|nr:hypothetical protein [Stenotrophomonas maltophilia]